MASSGDRLGAHYLLVEEIGEGGMGVVWKAEDTVLGRTVAIKFLTEGEEGNARRRDAFLREARLASSLSHGRVAQVYEFGRDGGFDFIVMEFVEGTSLDEKLREGPLPPETVVALGEQAARALSAVHQAGILHRDIKPSNLIVTPQGMLKLVDFGLAALHTDLGAPPDGTGRTAGDTPPRSRSVAGTISFMSPEQVLHQPLGPASDVFALGIVLYEMATGVHPFPGSTPDEVVPMILAAPPRRPRAIAPSIPEHLERILLRMLAKRPEDRFPNMEAVAAEMRELRRSAEAARSSADGSRRWAPRHLRRRTWAGLALLVAAAGIFVAWRYLAGPKAIPAATIYEFPLHLRGGSSFLASAEATAVLLAWRRPGPAAFDTADRLVAAFPEELGAHALRVYLLGSHPPLERERLLDAIAALDRLCPGTPYSDLYRARIDIVEGRLSDGAKRLERVLARDDLEPALRALVLRSRTQWTCERELDYLAFDLAPAQPFPVDPSMVEDLEQSIRLDPETPWGQMNLAWYLRSCGKIREALPHAERAVSLEPSLPLTRLTVAGLLALERRWDDAARELEQACRLPSAVPCGLLPLALYRAGRKADAADRASSASVGDDPLALYHLARYHAAAGDRARARLLVGRAVDSGFAEARIERDVEFADLRDDPEFRALVVEARARAAPR